MLLLSLLVALLGTFWYHKSVISELLIVGSGFTATTVCFGHYVSKRDIWTLMVNELKGIPSYVSSFDIDEKQNIVYGYPKFFLFRSVSDYFGFTAVSHYIGPDLGCRLSHKDIPVALTKSTLNPVANKKEINLPLRLNSKIQVLINNELSIDALEANQTRAIVVLQRGKIAGEGYQSLLGIGKDTKLLGWSMTKSLHSMIIGAGVQQGLFNLSTPVKLPKPINHPCAFREFITIGELLRMSDVLPFDENYAIHAVVPKMLYATHDVGLFATSESASTREISHKAKMSKCENAIVDLDEDVHDWYYSSGVTNLLAREIKTYFKTDEEYWNFPRKFLFEPLGIPSFTLGTDPSGTFIASSFSYGTARSWAKLGQLMLQRGQWNGRQLIPESFVDWVQIPHPYSGGHYGGSFWLNPAKVDVKTYNYLPFDHKAKKNQHWMTTALPADAYFMSGFEGQYNIIIPSLDVVITRLGFTNEEKLQIWEKSRLFGGIIAAALEEEVEE